MFKIEDNQLNNIIHNVSITNDCNIFDHIDFLFGVNLYLANNPTKSTTFKPLENLSILISKNAYTYKNSLMDIDNFNKYSTNEANLPYGLPNYIEKSEYQDIDDYTVNFEYNDIEGSIYKVTNHQVRTFKQNIRGAVPLSTIHLKHQNTTEIIKEAIKYFKKYMLNDDLDNNKIGIYLYDEPMWYKHTQKNIRNIDTIYLNNNVKDTLIADIDKFLSHETQNIYDALGINYKRTYMFEGLPGSGKSSLIYAIASKYNKKLAICNFNKNIDDISFINMLKELPQDSILVIEDIDCIFQERKNNDDYKNMITFSGLLNGLDGITTPSGLITIITSNYKDRLDNALVRPGRVDYVIKFNTITKEQIRQMFKRYMFDEYTEELETKFLSSLLDITSLDFTTCVIQNYLLNHIKSPLTAISNIDDILKIKSDFKNKLSEINMHS